MYFTLHMRLLISHSRLHGSFRVSQPGVRREKSYEVGMVHSRIIHTFKRASTHYHVF